MNEIYEADGINEMELNIRDIKTNFGNTKSTRDDSNQKLEFCLSFPLIQKLIAEFVGTYFLIFGGCSAVALNTIKDNVVTLPGIAMAWGMIVMVMIYSLGHISGAHFNPAVTIAFATSRKLPWKQVPAYIITQVLASTLASGTVRLVFSGKQDHFVGTLPSGSNIQALVLEFIATFYLMFVIYAVSSDTRANREFVGIAVGATVSIDILFSGPITGASMNPARSLGPAIIWKHYNDLWIYMVGPISGAVVAVCVYNFLKLTNRSLFNITKRVRDNLSSTAWNNSATKDGETLVKTIQVEEGSKAICHCPEGWKCVIFKVEELPPAKSFFECGQGCKCEVI